MEADAVQAPHGEGPSVRSRASAGPLAESKVSPAPDSVDDATKRSRRSHLLALAILQLRTGLSASAALQSRLRRNALLCAAVAMVAIAVQLYGIMAETDHWAKRLAGGAAVALLVASLGLSFYQVPLMGMNTSGRRSFEQLVRMAELWQRAAQAEA